MAKDIKFKLIVDGKNAEVSVTQLGKMLDTLGHKGTRSLKQMEASSKSLNRSMDAVHKTLGRLQRTLTAIAGVWAARQMIRGIEALVKTGIEFNKTLEQAKVGIGAVIAAQTEIIDATGRELEGREKLNAAQEIAISVSKELLKANKETAATYQQLVTMFQQALPHALAEGFSIRQVKEFVVAMSQAATSMGIPLNMMAEEMRAMLKGTITAKNTLIATALGMDKTVIKNLQGKADELFAYIMSRLRAFQESSEDIKRTWGGVLTNLKQVFEQTLGQSFESFFNNLKLALTDLTRFLSSPEFQKLAHTWASIAENMLAITKAILTLPSKLPSGAMLRSSQGELLPWAKPTKENLRRQLAKIYGVSEQDLKDLASLKGGLRGITVPGAEELPGMRQITIGKTPEDYTKTELGKWRLKSIVSLASDADKKKKEHALDMVAIIKRQHQQIAEAAREEYDRLETTLKLKLEIAKVTKNTEEQLAVQKDLYDLDVLRKATLGEYTEEQAKLAEQLNKLKLNKLAEELNKTGKMMEEMAKDIAQNMERAFEDFFFDAMNLKFGDMVDNFTDAIQRMFARLLASGLMKVIAGESWEEGIFGGIFGKIFSGGGAGGGESFTPTAGTGEWTYHFASGGVINEPVVGVGQRSGRGYIMGEAGPEAVVPLGGTAEPGNVIVNIENKGTEKNAEAQVRLDVRGMVIDIMMEDLISHGPYSQALKGGGV